MAAGDKYVKCENPSISWQELLNSLLVKDSVTGVVGLRTYQVNIPNARLSLVQDCGIPAYNLEEVLRQSIVLDAFNKPALALIKAT